ncbi:MAG TPA: HepT-like ribonuclease domain-containing protein [Rhizomicrobium sp.]|nr:HepT-like ribonuclease domain-containing protein [Rhizomicrobium sp.]
MLDIDEAIEKIGRFLAERDFTAFARDAMVHDAVVRNLEVISEASRFLPEETRSLEPDIPWRSIADMGNWLRHGYDVVNDEIIWETIERDLPALKSAVARILQSCG